MALKRRWYWGLVAIGIVILLVGGWVAWQAAQIPRYQWRTMDSWFRETTVHTNVHRYFDQIKRRAMRAPTEPLSPQKLNTPGITAFQHFETNGTQFLISQMEGHTNWWTRNDKTLRKWLPKFSHGWLPKPAGRTEQKKAALFLLAHLGTNETAHAKVLSLIRAAPHDSDLRGRFSPFDVRLAVLVATGGPTETTVESLLSLGGTGVHWFSIMRWLHQPQHAETIREMLPKLLVRARSAKSDELGHYFDLFEGFGSGSPDTLRFHEFCLQKHRYSRSAGPLVQYRPENPTLIMDLVTLVERGGPLPTLVRRGSGHIYRLGQLPSDQETGVLALAKLSETRRDEVLRQIPRLLSHSNDIARACGVKLAYTAHAKTTNDTELAAISTAVQGMAEHRSPVIRYEVAELLWQLHQDPKPKMKIIVDELLSMQGYTKSGINLLLFLSLNDEGNPAAVAALGKVAIDSEVNGLRVEATKALARQGPTALDLLRKLSQDPNPNVNELAAAAVRRLQSQPSPDRK